MQNVLAFLSYVYQSAKFFNFFARLFILFYFRSKKFRTSVNGKIKTSKQAKKLKNFADRKTQLYSFFFCVCLISMLVKCF